jgi:hypothetical protein
MSVELQNRLEELNEELELANTSLQSLIAMNSPDLDFQIEAITDQINNITKEIASIMDAIN